MLLNKQQVLSANDRTAYHDVEVPEWGGTVRVGTMSIADREEIEIQAQKKGPESLKNLRLRFLVYSLVDENGDKLFSLGDMQKLETKSAKIIDKLFSISQAINGIMDADVEELAKK